ncbi:MAG: choline/ethanolamine kinase family protein [Porticoccaceae bacterium]
MSKTQQILHQALSNWQHWQTGGATLSSQPHVVRELLGGKTNRSFLVADGAFQAVVRVNASNSSNLGIDRDRERKILQLLQPTDCVPKLLYSSDQVLVTEFCDGRHWTQADLSEVCNRRAVNSMLEKIQSIAVPDLPPRNYVDYCTAYINQLDQSMVDPALVETILSAATAVDSSAWPAVICHHDLVPENIIVTGDGLILLDWEYAAMGHPALDYLRLYQNDLRSTNLSYEAVSIEQVQIVQRAMDDLWTLVQD